SRATVSMVTHSSRAGSLMVTQWFSRQQYAGLPPLTRLAANDPPHGAVAMFDSRWRSPPGRTACRARLSRSTAWAHSKIGRGTIAGQVPAYVAVVPSAVVWRRNPA